VQDVLTNYYASPREGIENEKAYLVKSVINHAINAKNRKKRTVQPEVWLPEPVATEAADTNVYLKDILSYSLLVLLEKLNARERAAFILRESFDYSHQEIAEILGTTEENSRKLLSRAKVKLFKPGEAASQATRTAQTNILLESYIAAIRSRNMEKLEHLLAEDIAFYADGGLTQKLVKRTCTGVADVAELVTFVYHTYQTSSDIKVTTINHQPAFLFYYQQRLVSCQVFDVAPDTGRILQISNVLDPEKLKILADHFA
jgi:RNA polymerase sigma-70 factor (ECF subfamily)